jgi:hypothetical protein
VGDVYEEARDEVGFACAVWGEKDERAAGF